MASLKSSFGWQVAILTDLHLSPAIYLPPSVVEWLHILAKSVKLVKVVIVHIRLFQYSR